MRNYTTAAFSPAARRLYAALAVLFVLVLFTPIVIGQTADPSTTPSTSPSSPESPIYLLSTGLSFDQLNEQISNVSTLAIKSGEPLGKLPNYITFTMETAFVHADTRLGWKLDKTGTLRVGTWQTVYQTPGRIVSLGVCADIGATKIGEGPVLGSFSGCGGLAINVGALATKRKANIFIIPTYRLISLSGVQVAPSYQIRVGTGL